MTFSPPPQGHNFHPAYRPDIDGLRAVAILSVVIFHAFPKVLQGGFVGVDIFFVISGFLISSIIFKSLLRGDFSFTEFYAHRIKRIFPALILVLVVSYIFGWFALLPDEFKQLGKHMAAGAGFVQNFVLWQESGYFDTASRLKPLMHLWSLAIEEQFYLIYPVLIWGSWRLNFNIIKVLALLFLISFGLNVSAIGNNVIETFFVPQTRFWELLAGSVLAYLPFFKQIRFAEWLKQYVFHPAFFRQPPLAKRRNVILNNLLSFGGLLLIVAAIFGLNKKMLFPGWWALVPVLGAFLLILAGPGGWVNRNILANRLMVSVGLISYPLYLWHWPLLSFARIMENGRTSVNMRISIVVLSFLLAWLTYMLVEKPIRFGQRSWLKTAVLCLLIAVVGYTGYYTLTSDGMAFRHKWISDNATQIGLGRSFETNANCKLAHPLFNDCCYCAQAKTDKPTIILVGDSHSNSLYPGLTEVTRDTGDNVLNLAIGGCLPFFDVASFQKGAQDRCVGKMEYNTNDILQYLEKYSSINTIVMSFRGTAYLSGESYGIGLKEDGGHDRVISLTTRPDISDFHQVFETGMRATIERLLAKNKKIIFVIDWPEIGFDPQSCVDSRPLRLTDWVKQPCVLPRQDFEQRSREYRELVLSVLKDFPSVKVFDAPALLCDDQWCWAMKDHMLLYRDDHHLSIEGSRYLTKELVKLIEPATN